jgi:hypothetical protein
VFGGKPETACGKREGEEAVAWIHRRAGDLEVYFVASQVAEPINAQLTFRVSGKAPEFWNPETGRITRMGQWWEEKGRTVVPFHFSPYDSGFVIFRPGHANPARTVTQNGAPLPSATVTGSTAGCMVEAGANGSYETEFASGKKVRREVNGLPAPLNLDGTWTVAFPPGWGAPTEIQTGLKSWTIHDDPGVRFFSGTATYFRELDVPADFFADGMTQTLDLGEVKNLAEVLVNGQPAGVLWKPPFRAELTGLLKPGRNRLEIKVTNLWVNRMVGDELQPDDCEWNKPQFHETDLVGCSIKRIPDWVWSGGPRPQKNRYTFTTWKFYSWSTPLLDSGLLGPVTLRASKRLEFK